MDKKKTILIHHGIIGQKWGIRRYQNSDGTWTGLGKKHRAEKDLRESYEKARHANAVLKVSKMAEKGADRRIEIVKKILPENNIPIAKNIAENFHEKRERHRNQMNFVNSGVQLNAIIRQNQFYEKRDNFIEQFGSKRVKDLMDDSKLDMSNKRAMAIAYLTPFKSLRYGPIEYAVGETAKDNYKLRDFIATKL